MPLGQSLLRRPCLTNSTTRAMGENASGWRGGGGIAWARARVADRPADGERDPHRRRPAARLRGQLPRTAQPDPPVALAAPQLTSDFISNGGTAMAATTTSFSGAGIGHYLRQGSPVGAETLSFAANRDSDNRGNTYPAPLWLENVANFTRGNHPSWDCKNTGAGSGGSQPSNGEAPPAPNSQTVKRGTDAERAAAARPVRPHPAVARSARPLRGRGPRRVGRPRPSRSAGPRRARGCR